MIGIALLLAALAVTGVLAAVLVAVIRAQLRERQALARTNQPSQPTPPGVQAALGAPRKPALAPWLVVSGITVVLLTFMGSLLLRSCQAIGERRVREQNQAACLMSTQELAQWFAADWDQRKRLPPAQAVPVDMVQCPLGHRFRYVGDRKVLDGQVRVLAVETEPHEGGVRHAVGVLENFVEAGKTIGEYQQSAQGNPAQAPVWNIYGSGRPFGFKALSEAEYQLIRQAVEEAP